MKGALSLKQSTMFAPLNRWLLEDNSALNMSMLRENGR